jgi:hypothetical protein
MNYSKFLIVVLFFNIGQILAQTEIDIKSILIDFELMSFEEELLLNHQKIRTPPIQEVAILDSTLIFIIDTVLQQEKGCRYFSKDLCLSILFARCNDTLYETCYRIQFELCNKNTLLCLMPIGYFFYQNILIFIYDIVEPPKELFSYIDVKKDFNHYTDYDDIGIIDDRYSMYFFWYINHKFYYGEKVNQCK